MKASKLEMQGKALRNALEVMLINDGFGIKSVEVSYKFEKVGLEKKRPLLSFSVRGHPLAFDVIALVKEVEKMMPEFVVVAARAMMNGIMLHVKQLGATTTCYVWIEKKDS